MKYIFVKLIRSLFWGIFFGGVFFLPLFFAPTGFVAYENSKVWFVSRWIEVLVPLGLAMFFLEKKRKHIDTKIIVSIILFSLVLMLSSFFGVDFQRSVVGNFYRADGLITLLHLVVICLILSLLWEDRLKDWFVSSIVVGTFFTSIWALYDGYKLYLLKDQTFDFWQGAIGVAFGQPKYLTGYLLVTLPFFWYFASKNNVWTKCFVGLALSIQFCAILLTKSWAGALFFLFFLGFVFSQVKNFKYKRQITRAAIICFVLVSLFFLYSKNQQRMLLQREGKIVAEGRERIFMKLSLSILKRPIFGWGWANVDRAFASSDWPIKFDKDIYLDKAHSHFLEILVTTGIVGFIFYLILLYFVGKKLVQNRAEKRDAIWSKTLLIFFVLFIIHTQTNVVSVAEDGLFWILVGIVAEQEKFRMRA